MGNTGKIGSVKDALVGQIAYQTSRGISAQEYPFYSLIMSAMRQADTDNLIKLKKAYPLVWDELQLRYNAPGGNLKEKNLTFIYGLECPHCSGRSDYLFNEVDNIPECRECGHLFRVRIDGLGYTVNMA